MSRTRRSRVIGPALLALLVVALAGGGVVPAARSASLATGHAEVIAQGVVPFAGDALGWRVYDLRADPAAPRGAFSAATGFTLATAGDLLVADDTTGRRALLSPGEAAMSVDGDAVRVDAAGDTPSAYTRIVLLPDDFADAAGGEPIFASDGFESGVGDYDLSLVRDVLGSGDKTTLPESESPILLLVTEGAVSMTSGASDGGASDGGTPTAIGAAPLAAGAALAVDGPVTVAQVGDAPAVVVAAVVGERVAPDGSSRQESTPDAATPQASPVAAPDDPTEVASPDDPDDPGGPVGTGSGMVTVAVAVCPLGGVAEGCELRSDGTLVELSGPGLPAGPLLSGDATVTADGALAFGDLPYGEYQIQVVDQAVTGELVVGGDVVADPDVPGVYSLTVDADDPAPTVSISILPATGAGSIAVGFYRCPASLPVEQAAVWFCGPDPTGWDLTLSGTAIGGDLLLADAPATSDGAVFGGLPTDAAYALELTSVPEDVATVGVRPGLIAEGPVRVDLGAGAPNQTVTFLGIVQAEILAPSGDTDGDGLADNYETDVYGTDPGLADTDGDGSSDAEEVAAGTNPVDAAG